MRSILEGMLSVNGTTDVDLARYIVFVPSVLNLCPLPGPKRADGLSAEDYSNFVRTCLKRYISYKYTQGNSTLVVHLLDPEIERKIVGAATKPLTLQEIADLNSAFSRAAEAATGTARNPVVLTTTDVRLTVRRLIEKEHPDFAVVGYQELSPDLNIQPISRISWS
jgi:type III secretory pathway component EscV